MTVTRTTLITNQQYEVITDALNQNQRIVYDTHKGIFVSRSREHTKNSKFDHERYITDLSTIKEKIENFVKANGITNSQKEALTTAFSKRAAKRSWLIFTSSGAKQLTAIRQSILKIANHKEKIPQDSQLASSPGPQCNATHHIETKPIHLTQSQFRQLVIKQYTKEIAFAKKMKQLVDLKQDKNFLQILKNEKIGGLAFSEDEIDAFFEAYSPIVEASQVFQNGLQSILKTIQNDQLHDAMRGYENLYKTHYRDYAKVLAHGVLNQVEYAFPNKAAKLFATENAYRNIQHNLLGTESFRDWIGEPHQRAEKHLVDATQISSKAKDFVRLQNDKLNRLKNPQFLRELNN